MDLDRSIIRRSLVAQNLVARTMLVDSAEPANVGPTAAFSSVVTGLSVAFTDESTDSDGTIASWAWDFGDGSGTSTEQNPTYVYATAGTYTVSLTVTDDADATDDVEHDAAPVTVMPTFVAAGSAVNGAGDIAPAWPAHVAGDIAILWVEHANQVPSLGTANGFAAVTGATQGTGTAGAAAATGLIAFWCRATSDAMAAPVVADPGNHMTGIIEVYRGCLAAGDPYEAVAGDTLVFASTSVNVTIPGGTTTKAKCLILAAVSSSTDVASTAEIEGWANAALSDVTERTDYWSDTAGGGGFGTCTGGKAAAGAVGNTTATLDTTSAQARISFALIPKGTP